MSITKDAWLKIESDLQSLHGNVVFTLPCDDGESKTINVTRVKTGEGKYSLAVYIDGTIQWGWGFSNSDHYLPLVETVWRKRHRAIYKASEIKRIEKAFGKRAAKKQFPKLHAKQEWRDPIFTTAKSLVSQYRKIQGLELVSIGWGGA